jgi:hypothetical protein
MKKTILQIATISSLLLGISACASQRPVLSSNAHLMRVGPGVGERDIDECIARAEAASTEGGETSKEKVVAGTATGSVVGAAAGGAGGAVVGRAGQGAAAGAAGGAAASAFFRREKATLRYKRCRASIAIFACSNGARPNCFKCNACSCLNEEPLICSKIM